MTPDLGTTPGDAEEVERRRALRQAIAIRRRTMGLSYKELGTLSQTSASTVKRLILGTDDYWPGPLLLRSILQVLGLAEGQDVPVVVDGLAQIWVGDALVDLTLTEQQEAIRRAREELLESAAEVHARRGTFRAAVPA